MTASDVSNVAPVAQSELPEHAGCVVAGPDAAAGCAPAAGDRPAGHDAPQTVDGSAGCAPSTPPDDTEPKATPPRTVRELERALRGLGFSRKQAADIAHRGFAGVTADAAPEPERESDDMQALAAALQRRARAIER